MKNSAALFGAAILAAASWNVAAIQIEVTPPSKTVVLGDSVSLDINVSGLGVGMAPSIGTFDIDVGFDTRILDPTSVVFDTELDLFGFGSIQGAFGSGPVNVFEISLDLPSDLHDLQSDAFTLFTITFDTLAPGVSTISLALNALGDSLGDPLAAELVDGRVEVASDGQVPVPETLLLIAMGLLGIGAARIRRCKVGFLC